MGTNKEKPRSKLRMLFSELKKTLSFGIINQKRIRSRFSETDSLDWSRTTSNLNGGNLGSLVKSVLLILLLSSLNVTGQTDSLLCYTFDDAKKLTEAYEVYPLCDSARTVLENQRENLINQVDQCESQKQDLLGIIQRDSVENKNLNEIVTMCDKENKKLKVHRAGLGIVAILAILAAIIL